MKLIVLAAIAAAALTAADTLEIFGHRWTVPAASDWKVEQEEGAPVLRLAHNRGPLPGPRRPIQFAIAETPDYGRVTVDVEVKPLGHSLMIVCAYKDAAHFDYAHLSTDNGIKQPVHNGIFHVYGGERVRISSPAGPPAFPENNRWYRVRLTHDAASGHIDVTVDGKAVPALSAVDVSLGPGKVGVGSFDETADFRNLRITGTTPQ